MLPASFDFLTEHAHVWEFYKLCGEIRGTDHAMRVRMLDIAREIIPCNFCLHCPADVAKLIEFIYKEYDKEKLQREAIVLDEFIKRETFPKKKKA